MPGDYSLPDVLERIYSNQLALEAAINDADFALVLYTPCDLGRGAHENNPPNKRARQNVFLSTVT